MKKRLNGKNILVTAAGQGIGKATAIAFHNEGASVIATDINEKTLIDLNKERSIDVIITRLRKKIEENPKSPKYLQTIRGEGYVLWIE